MGLTVPSEIPTNFGKLPEPLYSRAGQEGSAEHLCNLVHKETRIQFPLQPVSS